MKNTMIMIIVLVQMFIVTCVVASIMLINGTASQYIFGEARCWIAAIGSAISYIVFMTIIIRDRKWFNE